MRNWLLSAVLFLGCVNGFANEPERTETLKTKVCWESGNGYFVLGDKSCWKVIPYVTRWRSPLEWWNGVDLTPKNYNTTPSDWHTGAEIAVYPKLSWDIDEANAQNKEELKQATHFFVNTKNGQILLAVAFELSEFVMHISQDSFKEGYKKSEEARPGEYSKGHQAGYSLGRTSGYREGFEEGYRNGVASGHRDR